jgi:HPt (histidine-containing phosphotransfer) domain-containing protein
MQSATRRGAAEVIDLESLEARCLGSLQLLERVLNKFTVQLEADLATLEQALQARDTELIRAVAHRLKGMSANVEAWPLHECAKEAEELAQRHDVDELAERLERFHEIGLQISKALTARRLAGEELSGE